MVLGLSRNLAPPPAQSAECKKVYVAAKTSVYAIDGNSELRRCATNFTGAHGIAADRLTSAGFGPERPVAPNDTEVGRQQNRRVEFHIDDETK